MEIKPQEGITDASQLGYGKFVVRGIQHLFAMFGATILVPALTGLPVSTTMLFAGLGTLAFHLISKRMVPAFLGSSFAFIGGYMSVKEMAYEALKTKGTPKRLVMACVIASQRGVDYLKKVFPSDEVVLVCGAIDPILNDHKYIVPGLGDAGDLMYGDKI